MEYSQECEGSAQACNDFIIDLCSTLRLCRCGFPKSEHENTEQRKRTLTPVQQLRLTPSTQSPRNGQQKAIQACNKYIVDLKSDFGLCQCGFTRSAHADKAFSSQTKRYSRGPLLPLQQGADSIDLPNETGACGDFMIDPLSAERNCRCGFPKSAHEVSPLSNKARARRNSDIIQALQENYSGSQVPSFDSLCPQRPANSKKASRHLTSVFDRFQAYKTGRILPTQKDNEEALTEKITCACGGEFSVTKEELDVLIRAIPDYESKTVAELIEFFSSLIPEPDESPASVRSYTPLAKWASVERRHSFAPENSMVIAKEVVERKHEPVIVTSLAEEASVERRNSFALESSTVIDTEVVRRKLEPVDIDSPLEASCVEQSAGVEHLHPVEVETPVVAEQTHPVEDESPSAQSDIAVSDRVKISEGNSDGPQEESLSTQSDIAVSDRVKIFEGNSDSPKMSEVERETPTMNEVIADDTEVVASAFQKARATWTEAAQKADEDAAAERAVAEDRAAKLRAKEVDAAANARRREETQAAKQREKELKSWEEERKKMEVEAARQLAEATKVAEEIAALEQKAAEEQEALLKAKEEDEVRIAKRLEEMQAAKMQIEEKKLLEEERQKKLEEERLRKLVAAKEVIAQRERNRLRKAAEREAEALRQAEAREQAARAKAAELAIRRTMPIACSDGTELMVTPDEKDALIRYVPDFANKSAEELADLLPKLHMGAWLKGSKHLFAEKT